MEVKLNLVKYRDPETPYYIYFWTERQGETEVHVSPMFHSEDEAYEWYKDFDKKVEECVSKLVRTKTG